MRHEGLDRGSRDRRPDTGVLAEQGGPRGHHRGTRPRAAQRRVPDRLLGCRIRRGRADGHRARTAHARLRVHRGESDRPQRTQDRVVQPRGRDRVEQAVSEHPARRPRGGHLRLARRRGRADARRHRARPRRRRRARSRHLRERERPRLRSRHRRGRPALAGAQARLRPGRAVREVSRHGGGGVRGGTVSAPRRPRRHDVRRGRLSGDPALVPRRRHPAVCSALRHDGDVPDRPRGAGEPAAREAGRRGVGGSRDAGGHAATRRTSTSTRSSQIRMPSWSTGRIALVGDAGACPSFLAGQGSALAMVEAYTLAAELARTRRPPRGVRPLRGAAGPAGTLQAGCRPGSGRWRSPRRTGSSFS